MPIDQAGEHPESRLLSLVDELANKQFIVFAGTGTLHPSAPKWATLLKKLIEAQPVDNLTAEDIDDPARVPDYPKFASRIKEEMFRIDGRDERWFRLISEFVITEDVTYSSQQVEIFRATESVITTNFDDSFENAFKVVTRSKPPRLSIRELPEFVYRECFRSPTLVYLHGKADARHLVFTEEEYQQYYPSVSKTKGSTNLEDFFKIVYKDHTLVFIGFSFEDKYVTKALEGFAQQLMVNDAIAATKPGYEPKFGTIQHYAFLKEPKFKGLSVEQAEYLRRNTADVDKLLRSVNIEPFRMPRWRDWIEYCFQPIVELRERSESGTEVEELLKSVQ